MTRFDAADPESRRELFADAVRAHRERASPYLTIEAEPDDGDDGGDEPPPWVQYGDGVLNLDCTEAELDDLKHLLGEFPALTIEELTRPDEAEGVNVRVSAWVDEERFAAFVERMFREVYGLEEGYRVWVVEV